MRDDTKRLLDRLGQPDFSYREYDEAPVSATDRWPLFEVIERQLNPTISRQVEDAPSAVEPVEIDEGNDVHALIARIAKGRPA